MSGRFGWKVIGQDQYDEERGVKESEQFGPQVTDAGRGDPQLSVKDVGAALAEDPGLLDRLLELEKVRPGGPRRGVLRHLHRSETEWQKREEVLDVITDLLAGA
jgi:hypothetical protein